MHSAVRYPAILILTAQLLLGAKLSVTVFDEKTGEPVKGLTAADFAVTDGDLSLTVESAEPARDLLDVMLVVDASFLSDAIRPLVHPMIQGLPEGAQMALVAFDQAATLVQDFTNSKNQLTSANQKIQQGNNPRVLDALYAVLDDGFSNSPGRRVAMVLSSGAEGNSRIRLPEIVDLARQRNVAVFVAYADGLDAGLFEKLAEQTGGAWFHLKKLKLNPLASAQLIHRTLADGTYVLDVSGVDRFGDRLKVEIPKLEKSKMKAIATARPVE
jgi:Mg-chelatase subunit ChlD